MYELVFTVIVLVNGQLGFNQTVLERFATQDDCSAVMAMAQQQLAKTAKDSKTVPGILECRRSV
jgi:hypothetical protein